LVQDAVSVIRDGTPAGEAFREPFGFMKA